MGEAALREVADSPALTASAVPTLILDREWRICTVNAAYERVSLQRREALTGKQVFAAFPDNPADPAGAGSTRLSSSLKRVLNGQKRHHLGFLRYDIPDPDHPNCYLTRVWSAVNSPILGDRRAVGVMQQVEDVTALVQSPPTELHEGDELATRVGIALAAATATQAALEDENDQLRAGLISSRVISVAIGILMTKHRITQDEAFTLLRMRSQHDNRKLRDIAEQIADTRALP